MPFPARIDPTELGAQALRVAEREGWSAWTLRDVARELGVTANALYRHVEDRAGLVIAMGEAATRQLQAAVRVGKPAPPPCDLDAADAAVLRFARRFVRFAARRPHAYAAFMHAKPPLDHPAHRAWLELWADVHAVVRASLPQSADAASFALWAFLHGRVELARGAAYRAAIDAGLDDAIRALLTGFRSLSPVPSPLPDHVRIDD